MITANRVSMRLAAGTAVVDVLSPEVRTPERIWSP